MLSDEEIEPSTSFFFNENILSFLFPASRQNLFYINCNKHQEFLLTSNNNFVKWCQDVKNSNFALSNHNLKTLKNFTTTTINYYVENYFISKDLSNLSLNLLLKKQIIKHHYQLLVQKQVITDQIFNINKYKELIESTSFFSTNKLIKVKNIISRYYSCNCNFCYSNSFKECIENKGQLNDILNRFQNQFCYNRIFIKNNIFVAYNNESNTIFKNNFYEKFVSKFNNIFFNCSINVVKTEILNFVDYNKSKVYNNSKKLVYKCYMHQNLSMTSDLCLLLEQKKPSKINDKLNHKKKYKRIINFIKCKKNILFLIFFLLIFGLLGYLILQYYNNISKILLILFSTKSKFFFCDDKYNITNNHLDYSKTLKKSSKLIF